MVCASTTQNSGKLLSADNYVASGPLLHRPRVTPLSALLAYRHNQMLLYVRDRSTGRRFIIGSGAEVSVIPALVRATVIESEANL